MLEYILDTGMIQTDTNLGMSTWIMIGLMNRSVASSWLLDSIGKVSSIQVTDIMLEFDLLPLNIYDDCRIAYDVSEWYIMKIAGLK